MLKEQEKARRIREVAADTGLSRELIHHYLRQGLLPRSRGRAEYSEQQVRLLQLIKKLREDHQLPLEVIRSVFQFFEFDPAHLEPLTLSNSLNTRMTQLAAGGDILSSETFSSDELIRRTGVSVERVSEYVEAKLVTPIAQGDEERFTVYDANIIALCERGLEIGIPFDSFRTIASYTRIAFTMEHAVLFQVPPEATENPKTFLGELFIRREITTSFIQNLLESLIAQRIQNMALKGLETRAALDRVLYRPSPTFIRRHAVDERIDGAQERISRSPDDMAMWLDTARLMLHAGRHREAVFFLEQALNRWPLDPAIRELYGRALVCAAQYERAIPILEKAASASTGSASAPAFLALALVARANTTSEVQQIPNAVQVKSLARTALKAARDERETVRIEVRTLMGWLLTALPSGFRETREGMDLLLQSFKDLKDRSFKRADVPGWKERHLINTAYLIFECSNRDESIRAERLKHPFPSDEELRTLICTLDPGCSFAQAVFLAQRDEPSRRGGT